MQLSSGAAKTAVLRVTIWPGGSLGLCFTAFIDDALHKTADPIAGSWNPLFLWDVLRSFWYKYLRKRID